ncbi:unnamed protein product [Euphydryas editha]|uniref:Uncharacterized protein n=1 Tax=Euphydryas editha TaxID=104508 RepID=A0AAU9UAJ2_EUPED|nr:unnamed protein product [Euphydryas editha]
MTVADLVFAAEATRALEGEWITVVKWKPKKKTKASGPDAVAAASKTEPPKKKKRPQKPRIETPHACGASNTVGGRRREGGHVSIKHCTRAQDFLMQSVVKREIDLVVASEPYWVPPQPNWFGDLDGTVAVILSNATVPSLGSSTVVVRIRGGGVGRVRRSGHVLLPKPQAGAVRDRS